MSDLKFQNRELSRALRKERYGGVLRVPLEVLREVGDFANRVLTGESEDFRGIFDRIEMAARNADLVIDVANSEWSEELPDLRRTHSAFMLAAQEYHLGIGKPIEYLNRWWEAEVLLARERALQESTIEPAFTEHSSENSGFAAREARRQETDKLTRSPT